MLRMHKCQLWGCGSLFYASSEELTNFVLNLTKLSLRLSLYNPCPSFSYVDQYYDHYYMILHASLVCVLSGRCTYLLTWYDVMDILRLQIITPAAIISHGMSCCPAPLNAFTQSRPSFGVRGFHIARATACICRKHPVLQWPRLKSVTYHCPDICSVHSFHCIECILNALDLSQESSNLQVGQGFHGARVWRQFELGYGRKREPVPELLRITCVSSIFKWCFLEVANWHLAFPAFW